MDVAALIVWLITAGGGFVLLGTWLARGGTSSSRLPTPLIFGHPLLAVTGLVLWIIYLANDSSGVAWTAFGILVVVALLGFTMFFRWLSVRPGAAVGAGAEGAGTITGSVGEPAENHFPVPIVYLHGLLAATTLVLVLLAAIDAS